MRKDDAVASIVEVNRPADVDAALLLLSDPQSNAHILAGGTDLLLQYQSASGPDVTIVDITRIPSLSQIAATEDGLRIGATARLADIIESDVIAQRLPVLIEGAASVAGPQIRNLATLGGNVCNASPSADTIAPLLVLGAEVVLLSTSGRRNIPIDEFFAGPGQTVLEPGELVESFWIPWPYPGTEATYFKLSPRRAMDLAVVAVAAALWEEPAGIRSRIGLGAVAPTPVRSIAAEDLVHGCATIDSDLAAEAGRVAAAGVSPISDVRGSAGYRKTMVERLVTRSLLELSERLTQGKVVA